MSIEWFLAKYRKKLLAVFFDEPRAKLNLHQLAGKANLDPGNATRYVQECVQLGLLKKEKRKNKYLISPNYAQPHIRKIFELFEVDRTWRFLNENENLKQPVLFLNDILSRLDGLKLLSICGFGRCKSDLAKNRIHLLLVNEAQISSSLIRQTVDDIWAEYGAGFQFEVDIIDEHTFEKSIKKNSHFYADFWHDRVILKGEDYLWRVVPETEITLPAKQAAVDDVRQAGEIA